MREEQVMILTLFVDMRKKSRNIVCVDVCMLFGFITSKLDAA